MSLIGIQVTGEKQHVDHGDVAHHKSICDDLAFEMYVDKQMAEIIRLLEDRKIVAVRGIQYSVSELIADKSECCFW